MLQLSKHRDNIYQCGSCCQCQSSLIMDSSLSISLQGVQWIKHLLSTEITMKAWIPVTQDAKEFNEALITYQICASKSLALSMSTLRSSSPMLSSHGISQERSSLTPADSSSFEVGVPRGVNIWFEVRGTDVGLSGSKSRLTPKPHAPLRNGSVHYSWFYYCGKGTLPN